MLKNISYNNPSLQEEINLLVGKPYTLIQRIKLKGIGLGRQQITQSSPEIHALLNLDNNTNTCTLEIRPKGIIVHFRSILETYGWVIPFYKLSIYKSDAISYSLHADQHRIIMRCDQHKFIQRIMNEKVNSINSHQLF